MHGERAVPAADYDLFPDVDVDTVCVVEHPLDMSRGACESWCSFWGGDGVQEHLGAGGVQDHHGAGGVRDQYRL